MRHKRWAALGSLLIAVLVAAPVLWPGAVALAAGRVTHQAWTATGDFGVIGAEEGKTYAAAAAGAEQARMFVGFDLAGETAESLRTGVLQLKETEGGLSPESAVLNACLLATPLTVDGMTATPPEPDCSLSAPLTRDPAGAWTLSLEQLAPKLLAAAGVAVLPVVTSTPTETYTVAFDPVQTQLLLSPAPPSTSSPPVGETQPPVTGGEPQPGFVPGEGFTPALPPLDEPPLVAPPPQATSGPAPETAPPAEAAPVPAPVTLAAGGGDASDPSYLLVILAGATVLVGGLLLRDRVQRPATGGSGSSLRPGRLLATPLLAYIGLVVLGTSFSGVFALQVGLTCIAFVAAIGLHLLANTTGELSLAHAGLVGLSAFAVAQAASGSGISSFYWIPLGIVVGALLGLVTGVAALRTRGIQVAVVTLSLYIATDRYLFRQEWLVGESGGIQSPDVSVFGATFDPTSPDYYKSLLPVLVVFVVLAATLGTLLISSRVGRAFAFVRSSTDAASAAGIPVNVYRLAAFGVAGAFAGLAGGMYAFWSTTVAPQAFSLSDPLNSSFFLLIMVVLAGPGGLAGLALSVTILYGVALVLGGSFELLTLAGPGLLILNLALYRKGLNGGLRDLTLLASHRRGTTKRGRPQMDDQRQRVTVSLPSMSVIVAGAAIVMGFCALALAWYHTGNTDQLWIQNQEMISGGLGGMALIVVGSALLVRDALLRGRLVVRAEDLVALTSSPPLPEDTLVVDAEPVPARRSSR